MRLVNCNIVGGYRSAAVIRGVVSAGILAILAACGGTSTLRLPDPLPDDRRDIPPPKKRKVYEIAEGFDQQVARPTRRFFDLSRALRRVAKAPKEAYNVDAFDEVTNSSWFTNRITHVPLTPEDIQRGPNTGDGPDTQHPWRIVDAKTEGVTPGFTIEDARGDRYVIKFDTNGFLELATGAEIVATKLFHAAGYNTPENYLVEFDPAILVLGDDIMIVDELGRRRLMTDKDLRRVLTRIDRRPDGRMRCVASKFISGKILGPFRYQGTRKDDPNDFVPHEHRRELRGLRIIAAWLNNYDMKANNSLDSYVEENGRRYVRHYLIDFGSSLGSQGDHPMPQWVGYENSVDPSQIVKNTLALGLYVPTWEKDREIRYSSIGRFDYAKFDPDKYEFTTPNPAFANMTERDGFWAAKIVSCFSDEQIAAAVACGRYSDPAAARYLSEVLIKRRDMVTRHWFDRVNCLDRFGISSGEGGNAVLEFVDLALQAGLVDAHSRQYQYQVFGERAVSDVGVTGKRHVPLEPLHGMVRISIRNRRLSSDKWSAPVQVYVRATRDAVRYELVAVRREA